MLIDLKKYLRVPVTGVIQVGAHKGGELDYIESMTNNILLFEPQKNAFDELKTKIKSSTIAENFALGSDNQENCTMYKEFSNDSQSSSLLKPALHLKQYPRIQFTETETVNIKTLDSYLEKSNIPYNILMIDVQGFELNVLRGAKNTLNHIDYILCEVNREELYENCAKVEEIDEYLLDFGFDRIVTNWAGWTWGDALYENKRTIGLRKPILA
jgi:FkbM family methyltransferase